ncbi:erythritol/L-threitol dehydrogenase [Burkholderia pseudomallei]|uniref:erythritol/L-threitol dehydrogenase n=1 Tax=Burkholderia pseudomallei TaxID=28450 RepID=UPI00014F9C8D|nr:erythritol/L-threitol dehydrogenase [Burkholderia pseudomallei]AGR69529.1 zinc-binding dehydrogenase family protein [Burkholderia pseudomallei MSHR305]AHK68978.1 zinc-binding dehydrogenase family protein [Burkholderia pseudomallei MSHR520]AIP82787.1 zinc-binding dehydrogenase family protein [Burkholderia pseudomallei]APY96491.1 erythritol/L-threitol dehydrogenase [Burkholderia pseudomallei]APZ02576.1 erythritol/L-threitol dehydrogenase [Burkholderia pseudomallei]
MPQTAEAPPQRAAERGETPALPATMRAVVCHGPRDYRLEQVPVPKPGPDEILTQVERVGICMGDIKTFRGAPSFWGDAVQPRYVKPPMIPGHEFVCRVVALGPGAERRGVKAGDRVISEQIVPCWSCRFCGHGQYWMCQKHDLYGFQNNVHGAMAEYMIFTKEAIVHRVPDSIPTDEAILIEPLSCSLHAADRANVGFDDVVVVAGAGTLGLGIIGAARLRHPKQLIVLDMKPERAALARRMGADDVWNPAEENVIEKIRAITGGYGCDIYIEATGHHRAVGQGLAMLRKLGRFVEFSVFNDEASVDWSIIGDRKELDVLGSHLGPYMYPRAIEFIASRRIDVRGIVTHTFPLSRFADAFAVMERGEQSLKVVLDPRG